MKAWCWGLFLVAIIGLAVFFFNKNSLMKYGTEGAFEQTLGLFDNKTGEPLANTRFYLVMLKDSESDPAFKKPLFGKTDAQGRAARVFSKTQLNEGDYTLVENVGKGAFGSDFQLKKAGISLPTTSYKLSGCNGVEEYKGLSNKQGYTVYYSTPEQCDIKLDIDWGGTLDNLLN